MNSFENINNKAKLDDLYKFFNGDRRDPDLLWLALRQPQYLIKEYYGIALTGIGTTLPNIIKWSSRQIDVYGLNGIGVKTERISGGFVLDGNYVEGSDIVPVIKYGPSTAGAGFINWQLNYEWISDGQVGGAGIITSTGQLTNSLAWQMFPKKFPLITGTAKLIGSLFHFNLFRDPSGIDTYGADAALLTIGFYQKINTFGARTQFIK